MHIKRIAALLLAGMLALCGIGIRAQAQPTALTLSDKLSGMHHAMDSIALAMGINGEVGYAPSDPQFVWTVLYLMGNNWGASHPLYEQVERDGMYMTRLSTQAVEDMATGAFFDYSGLPELVDTSALMRDEDGYLFAPSDIGDVYTAIESYSEHENGNVTVALGMYSHITGRLGGFDFIMAPNPYAASLDAPVYYYSIMSASVQPVGE